MAMTASFHLQQVSCERHPVTMLTYGLILFSMHYNSSVVVLSHWCNFRILLLQENMWDTGNNVDVTSYGKISNYHFYCNAFQKTKKNKQKTVVCPSVSIMCLLFSAYQPYLEKKSISLKYIMHPTPRPWKLNQIKPFGSRENKYLLLDNDKNVAGIEVTELQINVTVAHIFYW